MRNLRPASLGFLWLLFASAFAQPPQPETRNQKPGPLFVAGFASEDISPPDGARMPGHFGERIGKGTRDPLLAAAAVFSDGTNHVALVGIDALFVTRDTVHPAREAIEKATGIPGANILIGASHTHTGGPGASCLGCDADPAYQAEVARKIAAAVEKAWNARKPAELAVATGKEDTFAFNRRFVAKDGREVTHPGKPGTPHHDDVVRIAGPIDPDVGVLAVREPGKADAAPFGIVVNYTCHVTVIGGDKFSADYPGFLRKHLQARYGEGTQVVFLQGACGDVTQVDRLNPRWEVGPAYAEMIGSKLANEAARALDRTAAWTKEAPVACAVETVPVRIRPEPDVDRERPAIGLGQGEAQDKVYVEERRLVAEERAKTPVLDCEVQAVRIGPLGIVTNGAEFFCALGLKIKECSPFKSTWISELSNEYIGYVPTATAFSAGGYECRTARSSKLEIDAGQKLVEGSLRALQRTAQQ